MRERLAQVQPAAASRPEATSLDGGNNHIILVPTALGIWNRPSPDYV